MPIAQAFVLRRALGGHPFPRQIPMPRTTDRRSKSRVEKTLHVEMRLPSEAIQAASTNVSASGIYLSFAGPIEIQLVVSLGSERKALRGQLVRLESRDQSHSEMGAAIRVEGGMPDFGSSPAL